MSQKYDCYAMIAKKERVTRFDHCQYLPVSQINYMLTDYVVTNEIAQELHWLCYSSLGSSHTGHG